MGETMKIIPKGENHLVIVTTLGKIDIKDNLMRPKERATSLSITPNDAVDIQGGPRLVLLRKEN